MNNCSEAIEFYKSVFGAKELFRTASPEKGKIDHAELEIGDSRIMLADAHPGSNVVSSKKLGGSKNFLPQRENHSYRPYFRRVSKGSKRSQEGI